MLVTLGFVVLIVYLFLLAIVQCTENTTGELSRVYKLAPGQYSTECAQQIVFMDGTKPIIDGCAHSLRLFG